jgi:transposase
MEIRIGLGDFSEAFKEHVVQEVEAGKLTQAGAMRKYTILGHSTILNWRRKYGTLRYRSTYAKEHPFMMANDEQEMTRLHNEIKALRNELDDARMKNVVLETMVDIAEKEFDIPIRKKPGAKQSETSK